MSDHEQLAERAEREADDLERAQERLGERIEDARRTQEQAAADPFIAAPEPAEEPDEGGPEADYPAKR